MNLKYIIIIITVLCITSCRTNHKPHLDTALRTVNISIKTDSIDDLQGLPVRNVAIAGTFNDWNTTSHFLKDDDEDRIWQIRLRLKPGSYKYMFLINGYKWIMPPDAQEYVDDGFGNLNAVMEIP